MRCETYCGGCLRRCGIAMRDDSFDHAFGTHKVFTEAPDCHIDDVIISRETAIQLRWDERNRKRQRKPNRQLHPIFQDILNHYARV